MYHRAADFFLHGNPSDPRIGSLWNSQPAKFYAAIALLPVPDELVTVRADGFDVPLIMYRPLEPAACCRPTVLSGSGYDGAQEDMCTTRWGGLSSSVGGNS